MRYIPLTPQDKQEMLKDIGVANTDELFSDIPADVRRGEMDKLPSSKSESELRSFFRKLSSQNIDPLVWKSYIGAGCNDHYIPSVVNQLALRGEFLTAYTPYQAEISQGTLQAIFEFQSMIANLYGMEVANASMYDGASSSAEAVLMSLRVNPGKHVYITNALHPDYKQTIESYLSDYDVKIHYLPVDEKGQTLIKDIQDETSCIVVCQPNFFGVIENLEDLGKKAHAQNALYVVLSHEAMAFGLLDGPGAFDADIVAGEGQSLGVEMNFGGPHVGVFATKKKFVRMMPGRLVGRTVDQNNEPGYVLTLSTREQHIRREKATSNICTNNSLCALKACIYMACVGERGLREIANKNYQLAHQLFEKLIQVKGVQALYSGEFFNEFVITLPCSAKDLIDRLQSNQIIPGLSMEYFDKSRTNELLISVTETKTEQDLERFVTSIAGAL